jgi:hypothetical protein
MRTQKVIKVSRRFS